MRLQIEGSDYLKGNRNVEDYNIPDNSFLILDYEDGKSRERRQRNPNAVRKIKEEQKLKIDYTIRGNNPPLQGVVDTLKYYKVKQLKRSILQNIGMEGQAEIKIFTKKLF
mmetsp:Transcript_16095/g.15494  ORF Transcript_16095/g.15494 Transcript_16095/m.15494 type:complete len:110 (+) Transcript_16095:1152-1481(+)